VCGWIQRDLPSARKKILSKLSKNSPETAIEGLSMLVTPSLKLNHSGGFDGEEMRILEHSLPHFLAPIEPLETLTSEEKGRLWRGAAESKKSKLLGF
jgi:hypothetical protein